MGREKKLSTGRKNLAYLVTRQKSQNTLNNAQKMGTLQLAGKRTRKPLGESKQKAGTVISSCQGRDLFEIRNKKKTLFLGEEKVYSFFVIKERRGR